MKLLFALYIFLLFVVSTATTSGQGNSLLWRISGNGLTAPSYLYGTMHVHDQRVFHFSDSVPVVFEKVDAFAMEIILDEQIPQRIMNSIFMDSSYTLKKLLTAAQYDSLNRFCQKELGTSVEFYDHMKPIFIILLLNQEEESDYESNSRNKYFLDQYLQVQANHQHKEVYGLESPEEQLNAFDFMSMEDQASLLMKSIRYPKDDSVSMERMLQYYIDNNLYNMMKFENDFSLPDSLFNQLITMRNARMAERIDTMMRKRSTFIAVGAGHLGSESGLVNMLRDKGYSVLPVLPVYNNYLEDGWYRLASDKNSFGVELPGFPDIYYEEKSAVEISTYKHASENNTVIIGFIRAQPDGSQDSLTSYLTSTLKSQNLEYVETGPARKRILHGREAAEHQIELSNGNNGYILVINQDNLACFLLLTGTKSFINKDATRIINSFKFGLNGH